MHRRSPVPLSPAPEDGEETVAETADSSVIIRMTPRHKGEEVLTVEMKAGERGGEEEKEEKEETKEKEEEPSKKWADRKLLPSTCSKEETGHSQV